MKKAVCVILTNNGKILAVSRKDNHSDFNLCGGKVDPDDPNIEYAIVREAKEETGLDLYNLKLIDTRVWGGYEQNCFLADYKGYIHTKEPHVIKWLSADELLKGSFNEYNKEIFSKLNII